MYRENNIHNSVTLKELLYCTLANPSAIESLSATEFSFSSIRQHASKNGDCLIRSSGKGHCSAQEVSLYHGWNALTAELFAFLPLQCLNFHINVLNSTWEKPKPPPHHKTDAPPRSPTVLSNSHAKAALLPYKVSSLLNSHQMFHILRWILTKCWSECLHLVDWITTSQRQREYLSL